MGLGSPASLLVEPERSPPLSLVVIAHMAGPSSA